VGPNPPRRTRRLARHAPCCLAYDLPLATLNVKDFKDLAEHGGLTLLGI
jgi:predicted nucleic acid-binding protein